MPFSCFVIKEERRWLIIKAYGQITLTCVNDGPQGPIGPQGPAGQSAINIVLGNESQNIPCDSDGIVPEQMLIEIPFTGYLGTSKVAVSVSVGILPNGITVGSTTDSTTTSDGLIILNVAKGADLGGKISNGKVILTFTIQGKQVAKVFTWCKTKAGAEGSMVIYELKPSVPVWYKGTNGVIESKTITFKSQMRKSNSTTYTPYDGLFVIKESTDNNVYTSKYVSATNENLKEYTLSSNEVKSVQCLLCEAGKLQNQLDIVTIPVLYDGGLKNEITELKTTIKGVSLKVDAVDKSITDKVWQTDITTQINNYDGTTVKGLRDQITEQTKEIGKITTSVKDVQTTLTTKADGSTVQTLSDKISKVEQDANGFKQTVENNYIQKGQLHSSARNLLRNSKTLMYKNYHLNNLAITFCTDELGNYLVNEMDIMLTID